MQKTEPRWINASIKFIEFAGAHPELGISSTPGAWIHFQRQKENIDRLIAADVLRRSAYRNRLIADNERFDAAVFSLLTTGHVDGVRSEFAQLIDEQVGGGQS